MSEPAACIRPLQANGARLTAGAAPVFVTGGTGFVGGQLVAALLGRGQRVRALARPTSERAADGASGLERVTGDVLNRDSLRRGMEGCSDVFHLAAYAKNWAKDPATFFRVNVEGARNVFEAARESGVRRLVYTSTVVVFGPTPPGTVGDEAMPRATPGFFTEYEESKAVAEKEALEYAARGLPVVVVHPTRLYGPGPLTEGNSVSLMIDQYDRGRFPALLDGGGDVGNYAFVNDVVEGHLLAMENGRAGERYLLGGENVSLKGLFALVDEITGQRHFQMGLPRGLALLYAGLEKRKAEWLGIYPKVTPGWVETFLSDWAYTSTKAERQLGYRITPLREGLRLTLDWLHRTRANR